MASTTSFLSMGNKERGEDEVDVVIKVKYGDILRRFNVYVHRQLGTIEYDMNKLRAKISSLFKFSNDAILILTYADEDDDVVALDNDDELRDAVLNQKLNPLRITVQLKPYSTDRSYSRPNGVKTSDNSSDIRPDATSPSLSRFPGLAAELNSTVEKSLKPIPDPIRGVLKSLSRDVIRTASTAPVLSELLLLLSKLQLTNLSQSSQEPTGKPVDTSCRSPSRAADLNTCDEPKISNDLQNQLPSVLPQTNFVSPIPDNIQKLNEGGRSSQCLGSINYAPVDFNQNMSKEWKDNSEIHRDGKSVLAAVPPISFDTKGGNSTLGSFDKPNPFVTSTFLHGNTSSDGQPSGVTSQFPLGFTSQGDTLGNRHGASTGIPFSNTRPSDVTSRCPFNTMFSFPPNGDSSCKGRVLGNMHGAPTSFSFHSPMLHPYRRSSSSHDHTSRTFHRGVICDGCGMHPIMGPRYKSTVKENYDLCVTCFRDMGKETEYTRIDWSGFRFPKPKKDHHKHKHRNRLFSMIESHNRVKVPRPKLGSCFIRDVTVWDGTVMRPLSRFTKIWRMRNNGAIAWPSGTQLVWVRGNHLVGRDYAELEIGEMGFPVDEELDVAVDFIAPSVLGQYMSYWQMMSPSGQKFGEEVWVIIEVDDQPSAASSCASPASLNLNLPPETGNQTDEIIVYTDPLDCIPAESDENKLFEELLEPFNHDMLNSTQQNGTSILQPSSDNLASSFMDSPVSLIEVPISSSPVSNPAMDVQESLPQVLNPLDPYMLNSILQDDTSVLPQPSIDILASSFTGSSTALIEVPTSSSPVSKPAIDIPDPLPPVSYPLIDIYYSSNPPNTNYLPSDVPTEENTVEQTLLRELEEMGFKQIDLNKEILRQNHYDLERSVEDLCDFDEWDPLLKELHEMGFNDRELNRKLLSKNGGSIKRAVMELITGEKGE